MTWVGRIGSAALLVTGVVSAPAVASAQTDSAAAESLFQEGKRLMEAKDYDHGCPKLAASLKLDPGAGGTQMLLAYCHELGGKTATAWAEFNDALATAKRDGRPEREKAASEHIAALSARLSRLTIRVPSDVAKTPGLVVTRDGEVVAPAALGAAIAIDPGEHVVEATATGKRPWKTTVTIGAERDAKTLDVGLLADENGASATSDGGPRAGKGTRTAAYVIGGVGVVALAAGGFFGIDALSKRSKASDACPANRCPDSASYDLVSRAKTDEVLADVGIGVGLVGVGVAAYLLATSSGEPSSTGIRITPAIGAGTGGVLAGGSF